MRFFIFFLIVFIIHSCKEKECPKHFYGKPNERTGMSNKACSPICECQGFVSKEFNEVEIGNLLEWKDNNPYPVLTDNPYRYPVKPDTVCLCAMVIDNAEEKTYHLENFKDEAAAKRANAVITHYDACGVCSNLQDLAIYASNLDIGKDVRDCGINNFFAPFETLVACIEDLGFTKPCAQIWAYNTRNTQKYCWQLCLGDTLYNKPNGDLSDCLLCDEIKSGPVFKQVAGRTRRNTGIATSICRACEEVHFVEHNYPK